MGDGGVVETNVQCMTMVKRHTGILSFQHWFDNEIIFGESLALGLAHCQLSK